MPGGIKPAELVLVRIMHVIGIWLALQVLPATGGASFPDEIPFKFRDGFLWIEVTAPASLKPLNFLLDSGAQVSVVDSSTARKLGMKGGRRVSVLGVGSATTGLWPQKTAARAGKVELPRNYLVMDLSKLSQACTNAAVDGIIGADFFHDRVVQLDYRNSVVRILSEAPIEPQTERLPLKLRPCGMLVSVKINDSKPQWVRLDTGCASGLQWVTGAIRPEQCTRRLAVALTPFSIATTQTSLELGNVRLDEVPTDIQEKEIFPGEKGLLGNGVLSRFQKVTIDAKRKEVILGPILK